MIFIDLHPKYVKTCKIKATPIIIMRSLVDITDKINNEKSQKKHAVAYKTLP